MQPVDVTYPKYNGKHFHDSQLFCNIQAENVVAVYIYTDGSRCSGGCGYGIYAPKLEYRRMISIHDEALIFTAEVAAIKHAVKYVTKKSLGSSVIMSDSRSVSESIQNRKHSTKTHPIVLDIRNELNELRKAEVNTKFYWVKGLVGTQPNSVTGHLAKKTIISDIALH
ncbi:hypothetical protein Trydic_g8870 [Trypoxylus dichotomus]